MALIFVDYITDFISFSDKIILNFNFQKLFFSFFLDLNAGSQTPNVVFIHFPSFFYQFSDPNRNTNFLIYAFWL